MNSVPEVVTHEVVLEVAGPDGSTPVEAELRYGSTDPYAVTVAFRQPAGEVVWIFGRDLLMRGVSEAAGHGDVQVFPSLDADGRAEVGIMLRSPGGQALAKAPAADVLDFLANTTRVVWPGTESRYVDADEAIAEILVGG